jgi:menaquinone-dependent protoporphyrinogen oxidase
MWSKMGRQGRISRRRFLKLAAGTIGVTGLACCGLVALGARQPSLELSETSYGGADKMNDKLLVAYASRCGSTGEVAEAIGEVLNGGGAAVDVRLAKEVADLGPYQAVVVGSAIRAGQWLPEAAKFVKAHRERLGRIPVAFFVVCLTMQKDTEESRREAAAYLDPIREMVSPVDVGLFAGAMDYSKLPFLLRLVMKAMKAEEGDFRDWEAIRHWATNLRPLLAGG